MAGTSTYFERDGVRLHYLRWGEMPPSIVMLHPNSHCGGVWTPLAERLAADGLGVVSLDLRGHGRSAKPERDYNWSFLRDDAIGLLNALDVRNVLLMGHSRGGGASVLAAAASDRVGGLFVFEPTVPAGVGTDLQNQVAYNERAAQMYHRALNRRSEFPSFDEAVRHFRSRDAFKHWRPEYLDAFVEYGTLPEPDGSRRLACPGWVEGRLYEVMPDRSAWEGVHRDNLPVYAIYGETSGRVGPGRDPIGTLRMIFPKLESDIMPNGSHFGPMEHPEYFESKLRAFADKTGLFSSAGVR